MKNEIFFYNLGEKNSLNEIECKNSFIFIHSPKWS